jgi:Fic family protein
MPYQPRFTITPGILNRLETIQALHARVQEAAIRLPTLPLFQKDVLARLAHGSSAIEGNPLTLEEVRTVLQGHDVPRANRRSIQEILNSAATMRFIQKQAKAKTIKEKDVLKIHSSLGVGYALDRGPIGAWRPYGVRVGGHIPPHASDVPHFMRELLAWLNQESLQWPAVISSAILHYRFEFIHPFGDGNGRAGRALAMWELYRRQFDSRHIFALDETIWDHRRRYYDALAQVERNLDQDLTSWIDFMTEMLTMTLERTLERLDILRRGGRPSGPTLHLTPRQEALLTLLRAGPMRPRDIQTALEITKAGFHYLVKPLMAAGLIEREGGYKTGVYRIPNIK